MTSPNVSDRLTIAGLDSAPSPAVSDFIALLKPRVMSLVVFTGLAGMVMAPGELHPILAAVAILCIAVGAGAAGAINMWYDRDIDAIMERTVNRPIPAGRMPADQALAFGVILSIGSVAVMGLAVNWAAAALLALTIAFYVFVYTMFLKRRTPQNIVIGGAAGAFPPMIGWAAVNGEVTAGSLLLFAVIFFWTPPHFWALSLLRTEEYARAGVPMLPVVAGPDETRRQILIYSLVLAPVGASPWLFGYAGLAFGLSAIVGGALMIALSWQLLRTPSDRAAKRLFGFSILYLFALFAVLLAEWGLGGLFARAFT